MSMMRGVHVRTAATSNGLIHRWGVEVEAWYAHCELRLSHRDLPGPVLDKATTPITCLQCWGITGFRCLSTPPKKP